MTEIPVYRIPLECLYYNVANGRFAKEYLNIKKLNKGRELVPEDPKDEKEIERMLREQSIPKTKWLKNNIQDYGQEEPGIITHDGYVINGNRRMSVLKLLVKENSKFGYMNVGRLPENVSESDVYKIELGKQMAKEQKLDYGPINELLKIQHGLDSGLTMEQIANTIGFSNDEIKDKIERLNLIKEYLEFIEDSDNFEAAEKLNEHFVELQKNIFSKKKQQKQELTTLELLDLKEIAFATIHSGIKHMTLRKIPKMLKNPKIKPFFFEAKKFIKTDPKKTTQIFESCETRLQAEEHRDKPGVLLDAILSNLESLDLTHQKFKTGEYSTLIKKITPYIDELKKLI